MNGNRSGAAPFLFTSILWVRRHWTLLAILLAALALRIWDLGGNPPGFFRDEADKAVTAWSLLTSGRDLEGRFLPFFVRSLNVYTSGIYQYVLIPFILALGMSEWVIRLPAALAGTATVAFTCFLGKTAYGKRIGLLASGFLAISPWHVQFSRWANQGIFLPLGLTLAIYFFMRFLQTRADEAPSGPNPRRVSRPLLLSTFFLGLTLYTYAPAKAIVPLFLILLIAIYRCEFLKALPGGKWPVLFPYLFGIFILALPMAWYTFFESDRSALRFETVSLFHQSKSLADFLSLFLANYFSHFTPQFLAFAGDANLRHSVPFIGQLLKPEALLLAIGIIFLLYRRRREDLLFLGWLLLGPLPAALTHEGIPHALRSIAILPSIQIIAALGVAHLWDFLRKREEQGPKASRLARLILAGTVGGGYAVFGSLYLAALFGVYPKQAAPWWEYGYRQAIEYAETIRIPGDEIVFSGWAPFADIHVLYITRPDLGKYREKREIDGYRFLDFGQDFESDRPSVKGRTIYLLTPFDRLSREPNFRIDYPDLSPAWAITIQGSGPKR